MFQILSSIAFENIKSQIEEKQKTQFVENYFHFQIFQTFGNLEIEFKFCDKFKFSFKVTLLLC